jgi:predicted HicB family RNase H-like nuclease
MPPPSKGYRRRLNLRVPLALYVAVAQAAARAGTDINDWCTTALANATEDGR